MGSISIPSTTGDIPLRMSRSSPLAGAGLLSLSSSILRGSSSLLIAGLLERSRSRRSLRRGGESRPRDSERPRRGEPPRRPPPVRGASRPPSKRQLADGGVRAHYDRQVSNYPLGKMSERSSHFNLQEVITTDATPMHFNVRVISITTALIFNKSKPSGH